MNTLTLVGGGLQALIGDMNAAPEGGRWGTSFHSKTRKADCLTLVWDQCCLTEFPNIQRRATWKACLHPFKAILDRARVSSHDLPVQSRRLSTTPVTRLQGAGSGPGTWCIWGGPMSLFEISSILISKSISRLRNGQRWEDSSACSAESSIIVDIEAFHLEQLDLAICCKKGQLWQQKRTARKGFPHS